MARGFNKVILMGNLTKDPEIRYTVNKQAVASFTVAIGSQWKGGNGELQERTDFVPVVVWGAQAENCEKYLRKGRPVLVEGRIQVRNYDAKDGTKRWVTEVVASSVVFLGGRKSDEQGGSEGGEFGSLREKGFGGDDFPMDISQVDAGNEDEVEIPF